ncbi:MAG: phage shock protein operon transcriptional activator, partial [Lysobacterales bacterium]
ELPDQPINEILFDPFASPYNPAPAPEPDDERRENEIVSIAAADQPVPTDFRAAVAAFERQVLRRALERAQFKQTVAAKILGLSYHQFRSLLRKHGLAKQTPDNGD